MGIEVLVPDVNRVGVRLHAVVELDADDGRERRDRVRAVGGAQRRRGPRRADHRRARGQRPVRRLLRLLRAGRPTVLNKRTIESLIKAGAFDSLGHPRQGLLEVFEQIIDTRRSAVAASEAEGQYRACSATVGDADGDGGVRRARRRSPTSSSTRRERLALREGDARPLRERPPADGRRGGAAPAQSTARSPSSPSCDDGDDPHRRRRRHRPAAQVHQEGRPDGRLRARGPAGRDRGDGVPEDDDRARPQARRRRHRRASRAASTSGTTSPSSSPWRSSRFEPIADGAVAAAHRRCRRTALTETLDRASSSACSPSTPATRRCSSTSASDRCCACPTSSRRRRQRPRRRAARAARARPRSCLTA